MSLAHFLGGGGGTDSSISSIVFNASNQFPIKSILNERIQGKERT